MSRRPPDAAKIEKIREKCRASIFWTAWYLCGYHDISIVLHFALAAWFQRGLEQGERWILVLIPRGHFKTSLLNHAYIVWLLINNPNKRVLLIMHNVDEAKRKGRKLKAIMKSKAFRTYFPTLVPGQTGKFGTATEFTVNRTMEYPEGSLTMAGMSTGVVGGHYDVIIVDDGVDFKTANSPATMAMAVEFIESVDPLFEDETSILVVIGTLWPGGEQGYYEKLMRNQNFFKIVLGCFVNDAFNELIAEAGITPPVNDPAYISERILPDNQGEVWQEGQPIFPERRTMDGLAKTKQVMGPYKFAHQMLNVLLDDSQRRFYRRDFRKYTMEHGKDGKPLAIYIDGVAYPYSRFIVTVAMDPTGGMNKDSDWCGITACAWYPPQRFGCLLDFYHKQGPDPKTQIVELLDMGEKWDADVLRPESGAMQVWVQAWLKQEMVKRKHYFRIDPFSPAGVAKGRRILDGFQPYVVSHEFFVLYPEHEEVVDHLVSLNIAPDGTIMGDSPALADTFPMHADYWVPGSERALQDINTVIDADEFETARARRKPVRYGLIRQGGAR